MRHTIIGDMLIFQDWFKVKRLSTAALQVNVGEMVNFFLVQGRKKCILIDTGLGIGNTRNLVRKLTAKNTGVLLTHSHWDHIGGAYLFKDVGIHPLEHCGYEVSIDSLSDEFLRRPIEFVEEWNKSGRAFPEGFDYRQYKIRPCKISHDLHDGCIVELGDKELVVYHTPGHSPGSVSVFDFQDRILYGGDIIGANNTIFAQFSNSNLQEYVSSLRRISDQLEDIDRICTGHNAPYDDCSVIVKVMQKLEGILKHNGEHQIVRTKWGNARKYDFQGFSVLTKL